MNFNLDMAEAIRNVKRPTFKMPARPKQKKQPTKKATSLLRVQMNWIHLFAKKNLRNSIKNKLNMKKKKKGCFPLYWGNVHSQLEGGKGFKTICKENDVVELLKLIQGFSCHHDQNNDKIYAVLNSLRAFFVNYQRNDMTNNNYLKEFLACISTLDDYIPCLLQEETKKMFSKGLEIASKVEVKAAKKSLE